MITSLSGTITHRGNSYLIIEVRDVGYRVFCTPDLLTNLKPGTKTTLFTHEVINDNGREIFGFPSIATLELFWQLITVSGIGPRAAIKILSIGSADEVRDAIENGDLSKLTSVPGVGKKKAQKIVLELKGKLVEIEGPIKDDILDALISMGYGRAEAREAISNLSQDLSDEDRLREALKQLKR